MRDILATIPIILLIPALIVPLLSVGADSLNATLTVSGSATPGSSISVSGDGFTARDWIELRWDGAPTGTTVRVGGNNGFSGQITVPVDAVAGTHEVAAHATSKNGRSGVADTTPLAVATVQVDSGTPTPTPTPAPTTNPTPAPTPIPTPAPTPAPTPTPASTPTPTPAPTAWIVSVAATNITQTGATITWTVSAPATGQIEYGTTTAYGTLSKAELTYLYSTHVQTISGLAPATTYHFRVRSTTLAGISLISGDYLFRTTGVTATPTPTPSATPTPTPTTTPTPSPTPAPDPSRPFAAPVTSNVVNVSTGASLQTVVNSAPDGTEFRFPAGASYTLSSGIRLSNRHNLVFNLNGSTIRSTGPGGSVPSSVFYLDQGNSHITVSNGTLQGSNPDTGSAIFHSGSEYQMGSAIYNSQQIELDRVRVRNTYGDGVYVSAASRDVWVHDSSFDYIGRMGVAFIAAQHVTIARNTFDNVGLIVFDIEPNASSEVVNDIHINDNTVGWYSLSPYQTNWFFAAATASTRGILSNIYIERNNVTGGPMANVNNGAGKGGLATNAQHARITGLVFRNNTTTVPGKPVNGYPAPLYFNHIDGLTVTGNVQPVTSGSMFAIYDSTSVTHQ